MNCPNSILEKIFHPDVLNPATTLVAAFAGSWAAFKLQAHEKAAETKRRNIAAGNRALFTIMEQANCLKLFQADFVEPVREHPGRHIMMRPTTSLQNTSLRFDYKELDFLLEDVANHQLYADIMLEDRRFDECMRVINHRSDHHFNVAQPKLNAAGIREGKPYNAEDFRAALGELDYLTLERLTNDVVRAVDRSVKTSIQLKDRLRSELLKRYPDGHFLDFDLLNELPPRMDG